MRSHRSRAGPPVNRVERGTLRDLLTRNAALRDVFRGEPELARRLNMLQTWQTKRLLQTYKDLHDNPRYAQAIDFFMDDLYGSGDPGGRDRDLLKVQRMMERLLPRNALLALCLAVELEVLSQELDAEIVRALPEGRVSEESYAAAYRQVGRRADRERQINLTHQVGVYLDSVVHKPIVRALVHLAHAPAHAAGFGHLQDFLERGLAAFERMHGADEFLTVTRNRELKAMERLFSGNGEPFNVQSGEDRESGT